MTEDLLERIAETGAVELAGAFPSIATQVALGISFLFAVGVTIAAYMSGSTEGDEIALPISILFLIGTVAFFGYLITTKFNGPPNWGWFSLVLLIPVGICVWLAVDLLREGERWAYSYAAPLVSLIVAIVLAFTTPPLPYTSQGPTAAAQQTIEDSLIALRDSIESNFDVEVSDTNPCVRDTSDSDYRTFLEHSLSGSPSLAPGVGVITASGLVGCYGVLYDGKNARLIIPDSSELSAPGDLARP